MSRQKSPAVMVMEIDETIRAELPALLELARQGKSPALVLGGLSRLSLILIRQIFAAAGTPVPSDNLYDCLATAGRGDPVAKIKGQKFLPDEIITGLHTIRVFSNKADHAAESIRLSPSDARTATDLFLRTLRWFYIESELGPKLPGIWQKPRRQFRSLMIAVLLLVLVGLGITAWSLPPGKPEPISENRPIPAVLPDSEVSTIPTKLSVGNPRTAQLLRRLETLPTNPSSAEFYLEIVGEKASDKRFTLLKDGESLRSGIDLYRLYVASPADGYLYVCQIDSSAKVSWLFPKNASGDLTYGSNPVAGGKMLSIPDRDNSSGLDLDRQTGKETILAIFSPVRWEELEADLLQAAKDSSPPSPVTDPLLVSRGISEDQPRGVGGERPFSSTPTLNDLEMKMKRMVREKQTVSGRMVQSRWFAHVD